MGIEVTYPFTDAINYNLSNTQITGGKAKLSVVPDTGKVFSEPFTAATGFTYDSTKAEFVGGVVRQKDMRPTNATFWNSFASSVNGNWGGGTLTGTNNGGTLSGGALQLLGGATPKYIDLVATANADSLQVGCIRIKVTPGYSGTPATNQHFFRISQANASANNAVGVFHSTAGNLDLRVFNSAGTSIISVTAGAWVPVSGTTYELEFNWDITTGATRLFVDGVQLGATVATTGTRSGAVALLRLGESQTVATNHANFSVQSFLAFSAVQHTANYTPGADPYDYIYAASTVILPLFSYTGYGAIQSIQSGVFTGTNAPRFTVAGKYWNGSAWVASASTYAQANDAATIVANIATLSVLAAVSILVDVFFTDAATQSSVDIVTITYTGQKYSALGYLEPIGSLSVQELLTYVQSSTGSTVGVILKIDGVLKYWNGSAWVTSDGSAAQSNPAATVNTNLPALDLGTNSEIFLRWVLSTADVSTSPELDSATVTYDFGAILTAPTTCIVYGYILDISGAPVVGASVAFSLKKNSNQYMEAAGNITGAAKSVTTDDDGYFECVLIRSSQFEDAGTYIVAMTKTAAGFSSKKLSTGTKLEITVPDADTKNLTDLLTAS